MSASALSASGTSGFIAADKLEWQDINDEASRTYFFANGGQVTIDNPEKLNVKRKENGDSHRVIAAGASFYIPAGWIAIKWVPKQGAAPYAF